jgi:hypothetical protein
MESSPTQLIRFSFHFGYEPLFASSFFGALILALSHPSFTARSSAYHRQFTQWFLTPFSFKPTRPDEPVSRHAEEFGIPIFYQRLCQAGEAKKFALMACMRKLLTILNAMLKRGTPWRMTASQPA